MSYSYYDFNRPRVLVEIDCGADDCETKAQVPANLRGRISEGGDRSNMRYRCALHVEG